MSSIQDRLNYVDEVAQHFLDAGKAYCVKGDLEESLKCTYIAATVLSRQNRTLSSPLLESNLHHVARCLEKTVPSGPVTSKESSARETTLHVLSEALPAGGLTAMAIRWIRNDRSHIHSVALLSNDIPIPEELAAAVADSGGTVYTADASGTFVERACWLRTLALTVAAFVVLHIDVSDVICGAAFGVDGGPPVLLVNHTAHTFWSGATIADLVLNVRGSDLEIEWTKVYRGARRSATLPIPLLQEDTGASSVVSEVVDKRHAKKCIGIPADATMLLTVGASFKYLPAREMDFVDTYEHLLADLPDVYLVVAGFAGDSRWNSASERTGSRIRLLGTLSRSELARVHDAADIYVEAFPFGTTTALLEAGLKGIPAILSPLPCVAPYGSDGVALDELLERSETMEAYQQQVRRLCLTPDDRMKEGHHLRQSIAAHHTGAGWIRYLLAAIDRLPQEHSIQPSIHPTRTPQDVHEYWSAFSPQWTTGYDEDLEHAIVRAFILGLHPRLTPAILRHHKSGRAHSPHGTMPTKLLGYLCNSLLPHFPSPLGGNVFRAISFLYRGPICERLVVKALRSLGLRSSSAPYAEYRRVSR